MTQPGDVNDAEVDAISVLDSMSEYKLMQFVFLGGLASTNRIG